MGTGGRSDGRQADGSSTRGSSDQGQRAPERFVHGAPRIPHLPTEVWINRAEDQTAVIRPPH